MIPRLTEAHYAGGYSIGLRFSDGTEGEVDLKDELWGPVFEPLKDLETFKRFRVHPDLHTIVWENEADFSPEFLYRAIKVSA